MDTAALTILLIPQDGFAAFTHTRPVIDESQDWFLVDGWEENGHTVLEFMRKLSTGDLQNDVDIEVCKTIVVLYGTKVHYNR